MIKTAKIFQGGDYPDKGINVTEDHLDAYIKNFTPCQIKIEHSTSIFDNILGTVKEIYRHGLELFGKIDFTKEAWALIEKSGKKSLSVSINPNLNKIEEVSLVTDPRVKDARIFSFSQDLQLEENNMDYKDKYDSLLEDYKKLKDQMDYYEADKIVEKYFSQGKILPANKDLARELLKCDNMVSFNDDNIPVKNLFTKFLDSLEVCDFSQIERKYSKEDNKYTDEQNDFAKKLGINLR